MPKLEIDCLDCPEIEGEVLRFLENKLRHLFPTLPLDGDVTIRIGSDEESRQLNRDYRGKDYPTDVLSFPLNQSLPDGSRYCGDIHIACPVALKQAEENEHPLRMELLILSVHGLLHLSGYDHEQDQGEMMALQEDIVRRLIEDDPEA